MDVETVVGERGEFTVWVNEQKVLAKGVLMLPSEKKIVGAVREGLASASGSK